MSLRNQRREQQRRQREYHERYGIKMTSIALRPALHIPATYLKEEYGVTLSDIIQMGLRVYQKMNYFDKDMLATMTDLERQSKLPLEE